LIAPELPLRGSAACDPVPLSHGPPVRPWLTRGPPSLS
jgi:hypothetical protein